MRAKVEIPTLYLYGDPDPFMATDQHRDTIARLLSGEFTFATDAGLSIRQMFAPRCPAHDQLHKRVYRAARLRRARPGTS